MASNYKYKIGYKFLDEKGNEVVITGYNIQEGSYRADVEYSGRKIPTSSVYENALDNMIMIHPKKKPETTLYNYKIYYTPEGADKSKQLTIKLSGFKALVACLGGMIARNRKIVYVCIEDDNGAFLSTVHFVNSEYKEQKFERDFSKRLKMVAEEKAGTLEGVLL
jgi:hypothetical protein